MEINYYQQHTKRTAIYPGNGTGEHTAVTYTILGLTGEAGELANKWKKSYRDGNRELIVDQLKAELGDVMWYISQLATELGVSLEDVCRDNLDKLRDRQTRSVLSGSGDTR